jgi:hypothetical protein
MKLTYSLCASLFLFLAAWSVTSAQTSPAVRNQSTAAVKEAPSSYAQLVERAKKEDPTVDFVELRNAYAEWLCDEKAKTDAPNREAMVEAFKKKDYAKASELAEVVLDYEFVNRGLHLATENAYRQLGNQTQADKHKQLPRSC